VASSEHGEPKRKKEAAGGEVERLEWGALWCRGVVTARCLSDGVID